MEAVALRLGSVASPTSTVSYCRMDVNPDTANASRPTRTSLWTEPVEAQICTPAMKLGSVIVARRQVTVEMVPITAV